MAGAVDFPQGAERATPTEIPQQCLSEALLGPNRHLHCLGRFSAYQNTHKQAHSNPGLTAHAPLGGDVTADVPPPTRVGAAFKRGGRTRRRTGHRPATVGGRGEQALLFPPSSRSRARRLRKPAGGKKSRLPWGGSHRSPPFFGGRGSVVLFPPSNNNPAR